MSIFNPSHWRKPVVTMREWAAKNKITMDPLDVYAGDFLEAKSYRFLIEFGNVNAVKIATTVWIDMLEERYKGF